MRQASFATAREHYHRQIHMAADEIVRNRERTVRSCSSTARSSSGKTTTNDRIARIVELAGVHANMLSMDDYYRTAADYEQPMDDENGVTRSRKSGVHGSCTASDDLARLVAGEEVSVPRFDFETRTIPHDRTVRLDGMRSS